MNVRPYIIILYFSIDISNDESQRNENNENLKETAFQ